MQVLHQKIQALRNSIGSRPIHYFHPAINKWNEKPVEVRAPKQVDGREISQYFCIFGVPDDYGTVPVKGCFAKSLSDRGPQSKANYKITVLNQHDQKEPLCLPSSLIEDEIGLKGVYTPDEGIPSNDSLVIRVKKGTINGGSYGFNYIWDKMEYQVETGLILMKECDLYEVSPVTIGSQKETFVVRSVDGTYIDKFLEEETEEFMKNVPRKNQLELRNIINRHITLAGMKPLEISQDSISDQQAVTRQVIDYNYLLNNLNF